MRSMFAPRLRILTFAWALLGAPMALGDAPGALPEAVARALSVADIPESAVAIVVQLIGAASPALAVNPDQLMNPASLMKLVTSFAALDLLGPAYQWSTSALIDGKLDGAVLRGNLVIRGEGDPKLTIERLWLLVRRIRQAGIREISGDVILDASRFSAPDTSPGAFDGKPLRAYNALPSALLLNFNAANLNLASAANDDAVIATLEPQTSSLTLVNRIRSDTGPCGDWKERLQISLDGGARNRTLTIDGWFARACGEKAYPLSLFRAEEFFAAAFSDLWRESGGILRGSVRPGALRGAAAGVVARLESPPLAEAIRDMNKFSNNVMARQIFLTLGAEFAGPPGTPGKAREAIAAWLDSKGIGRDGFVIDNGSGLSRQERATAGQLARLLLAGWQSPLMPELVSSLPIAAVDGTLKRRDAAAGVARQAHLKTGTLDGVRALAGYAADRDLRPVIVVFIVNHPRAAEARVAEDALLDWLVNSSAE